MADPFCFEFRGTQITLHLPAQDHVADLIRAEGSFYELSMLDDMASRCPEDHCVLDVGAHVGNHSIYLAKVAGLGVVSCEPNAESFEFLNKSVQANRLKNRVTLHNTAVGATSGRGHSVSAAEGNSGCATFDVDSAGDVPMVCVDELKFEAPVGVIKIDVEGMELQVLQGAVKCLYRDAPYVYVEAHDREHYLGLRTFFRAQGYLPVRAFNATPTFLFAPARSAEALAACAVDALESLWMHEEYADWFGGTQRVSRAQLAKNQQGLRTQMQEMALTLRQLRDGLASAQADRDRARQELDQLRRSAPSARIRRGLRKLL